MANIPAECSVADMLERLLQDGNLDRLLAVLFATSAEAILLTDAQGNCWEANPAACELFGLDREALRQRNLWEWLGVSPQDLGAIGAAGAEVSVRLPFGAGRSGEAIATIVPDAIPNGHLWRVRVPSHRESRLQAIADAQPDLVCCFLPDCTLTFVNQAYCNYFGRSREALLGTSFLLLVPPSEREPLRQEIQTFCETYANNATLQQEHRVIDADGNEGWQEWTHYALRCDPEGKPLEFQATGRDITLQKRLQAQLEASQQKYRILLESLPIGISIADRQGQIVEANPASVDLVGLSVEDHLQRTFDAPSWQILRPDGSPMPPAEFASVRALREQRAIEHVEKGIVLPDGSVRWLDVTAVPLPLPDFGVAIAYYDITQRKLYEERLKRFERIISATQDGIALLDRQYTYQIVNQTYLTWHGKQYGEVVGHTVAEVLGEAAFRHNVQPYFDRCLAGERVALETWFTFANQTRRFVGANLSPYREPNGTIAGVVLSVRDLTPLREAEDALRESEQRYRTLFEANPQPMWVYDQETLQFLAVNNAAAAKYGYSQAEFLKMTVAEILSPAGEPLRLAYAMPEANVTPEPVASAAGIAEVWHHRLKDGTTIEVEVSSHTLEWDGRPAEIVLVQDITARRRAELALQARNRELQTLQRIAEIALRVPSLHDALQEIAAIVSAATEFPIVAIELYDRDRGVMVFAGTFGLPPRPADDPLEVPVDCTLSGTVATTGQVAIRHYRPGDPKRCDRDATLRHLGIATFVCLPLQSERGNLGTLSLAHDQLVEVGEAFRGWCETLANYLAAPIERKQTEAELRELSQRLTLATTSAEIGIWDFDVKRGILNWDDRQCALYGIAPEEFGRTYADWARRVHPDDLSHLAAAFDAALAADAPELHCDFRIMRPDGEQRYIEVHALILRNDAGEATRLVGVNRDITDRRQAELALTQMRDRLNYLLAASPTVIYVLLPHNLTALQFASENLLAVTGYPAREALDDPEWFSRCVHPDDLGGLLDAIATWIGNGASGTFYQQYRFRKADGTWIWLGDRLVASRNAAGEIVELIGAFFDVTAQVEGDRRLERISQQIPGFICQYRLRRDGSSHFPYASEGIRAVYGVSPEDVRDDASCILNVLHPEDLPRLLASIAASADRLEPWHCEYRVILQGEERWLEGRGTPQREPDGSTLWHGYINDITPRKREELARQAEVERDRLVADMVSRIRQSLQLQNVLATTVAEVRRFLQCDRVTIYTLGGDNEGTIAAESVGEAWQSFLGETIIDPCLSRKKVLARFLLGHASTIADVDRAEIEPCYRQMLQRLQARANLVVPILHYDRVWGLLAAQQCDRPRTWQEPEILVLEQLSEKVAIAIQQAELYRHAQTLNETLEQRVRERTQSLETALGQLHIEITERNHAEMRVQQALLREIELNELKTKLISTISHEFRTPLSILSLSMDAIEERIDRMDTAQRQKRFKRMRESIDQMTNILETAIAIEEFEVGQVNVKLDPINLESIVSDLVASCQALHGHKFEIRWQVHGELPYLVRANARLLRQALDNLMANAIRYSPQGGTIDLELNASFNFVVLRLSDGGIGIAAEDLERVFEPFYRGSNADAIPGTPGMGLGLAIVKRIVDLFNGTIALESVLGQGTTVLLTLPRLPLDGSADPPA